VMKCTLMATVQNLSSQCEFREAQVHHLQKFWRRTLSRFFVTFNESETMPGVVPLMMNGYFLPSTKRQREPDSS
jgi:hypothetical protein